MEKIDREHLVRLLKATQTTDDGEVLRAMRFANSLLANKDQTWEDMITYGKILKGSGEGVEWAMNQDISSVFDEILEAQEEDTRGWDFIVSLQEQFNKNGALSEKQYCALKSFLENTRNPPWDKDIDYDGDPTNYYD